MLLLSQNFVKIAIEILGLSYLALFLLMDLFLPLQLWEGEQQLLGSRRRIKLRLLQQWSSWPSTSPTRLRLFLSLTCQVTTYWQFWYLFIFIKYIPFLILYNHNLNLTIPFHSLDLMKVWHLKLMMSWMYASMYI